MSVALARTYTANKSSAKKQGGFNFHKIAANYKWVQYSLDLVELNRSLQTAKFEDKYVIVDAIKIAERKRDYMYRHPNFNLAKAAGDLKLARRLLKL